MHVNLKVHGVWHVIEHDDDVEESKNLMTLTAIYQAVLEDVLLILAEKNSSKNVWKTLQKMHISVEWVKEAKVQTLKSEFEATRIKKDESTDDITIKLTTIATEIHSLDDKVWNESRKQRYKPWKVSSRLLV